MQVEAAALGGDKHEIQGHRYKQEDTPTVFLWRMAQLCMEGMAWIPGSNLQAAWPVPCSSSVGRTKQTFLMAMLAKQN